jgi:hypothetical protein
VIGNKNTKENADVTTKNKTRKIVKRTKTAIIQDQWLDSPVRIRFPVFRILSRSKRWPTEFNRHAVYKYPHADLRGDRHDRPDTVSNHLTYFDP